MLADKISVLVPTSPIPHHPSTHILDEVIESIRVHFPDNELFLMIDGVRGQVEHRRADYEEYKRRIIWKCQQEWRNVLPVVFEEYTQQSGMTRKCLEMVKTPLVFFVEHDAPIDNTMPTDWTAIAATLLSGEANMVRMMYWKRIIPEHEYLMLEHVVCNGAPFVKTIQYSGWPHLARVDWLKNMLGRHFDETPKMLEANLYGPVVAAPWEHYKVMIYYPEENAQRFYHRNGRVLNGVKDPCEW